MAYYKSAGINVTSNSNVSINIASGSIASFNTNLSMPVLETKASINPIQNGTPWMDSNEVNKVPYIKRAVAGTATRIGNHLYDKLVGGTVAFNQHIDISSGSWTVNSMTVTANNGLLEVSGTAGTTSSSSLVPSAIYNKTKPIYNHKYLLFAEGNHNFVALRFNIYGDTAQYAKEFSRQLKSTIFICNVQNSTDAEFVASVRENTSYQASFKAFLVDLTAMFGSTIADYIYSLEQATAGAGVAWFKALFPNDYYAYNAGELMSVKATAHVMKNASNQVIGNYALDSDLELRGIPKLVNNKLEYDGDTYESNGDVKRRYGIVDLGSLEWSYNSTNTRFTAQLAVAKAPNSNFVKANILTTKKYNTDTATNTENTNYNLIIGLSRYNVLAIRDNSYTDAAAFKASLSGVYLVYEKASSTTESASPFTNPQVCDENGTEEYTDNRAVAIPVGHETYQANICEISGFDELNIQQCGVNLINISDLATTGITYSNGDLSGTAFAFNTAYDNGYDSGHVFKANTQYTISMKAYTEGNASTSGNGLRVGFIYTDGTKSYETVLNSVTTATVVNCVSTSGKTVKAIYFTYGSGSNNIWHVSDFILAEGTTATYSAYSGKLIKLEFDDTIYLAEVSCLNGVWKLKLLGAEVDLGDLTPVKYTITEGNLFRYSLEDIKTLATDYDVTQALCSHYSSVASASRANYTMSQVATLHRIDIIDNRYSDATAFKAATSGVKLVYPLETPTEIILDETEQFEALLGVNNVWHDGNGNTEVKYRKVNIQ